MPRLRPIRIEVVAYTPVAFVHCMPCELVWQMSAARAEDRREQWDTSLPEGLKQLCQQISDCVHRMVALYGAPLRTGSRPSGLR